MNDASPRTAGKSNALMPDLHQVFDAIVTPDRHAQFMEQVIALTTSLLTKYDTTRRSLESFKAAPQPPPPKWDATDTPQDSLARLQRAFYQDSATPHYWSPIHNQDVRVVVTAGVDWISNLTVAADIIRLEVPEKSLRQDISVLKGSSVAMQNAIWLALASVYQEGVRNGRMAPNHALTLAEFDQEDHHWVNGFSCAMFDSFMAAEQDGGVWSPHRPDTAPRPNWYARMSDYVGEYRATSIAAHLTGLDLFLNGYARGESVFPHVIPPSFLEAIRQWRHIESESLKSFVLKTRALGSGRGRFADSGLSMLFPDTPQRDAVAVASPMNEGLAMAAPEPHA